MSPKYNECINQEERSPKRSFFME